MAIRFETFSGAKLIAQSLWNQLAEDASPAMEWEYITSLESSGAVCAERGYRPLHLMAFEGEEPLALAPLYERDRAWVEFGDGGLIEFLTELTGIPYDIGLVGTIPYTPVPGYRFLHRPEVQPWRAAKMLLDYIDHLCESRGLNTSRIYFVALDRPELHATLREQGYLNLTSQHTLWFNRGYGRFEDYLATFKSSRRTKIRRELRSIRQGGVQIAMRLGIESPDLYFERMYQLYLSTWRKHMGLGIRPFLNERFFKSLAERFRHRTSFSVAERDGELIAMALFYHKASTIYGRYWGTFEELPFLHFGTCYYHPIDYAIQRGISVMDPGFGGEHKLLRGYETVPVQHYVKFYGDQQRRIAMAILEQMQARQPQVVPKRS